MLSLLSIKPISVEFTHNFVIKGLGIDPVKNCVMLCILYLRPTHKNSS